PTGVSIQKTTMVFSLARQRFEQEVSQPDDRIDLAVAALCLAQEEYPELEIEEYLNALDTMAEEVRERLPVESYPLKIIGAINRYLYEDLGFVGNTREYYDPRNSFLNDVLQRRTGIPISLALVYLEIAKRIEFPTIGIGMPGHFLLRPDFPESGIYIDAFVGGEVLFPEDCHQRLNQIYGRSVEWRPEFLPPVSSRQFLARMLGNLKGIYLQRQDAPRTLAAIDRILLLFPDSPPELRDRGVLHFYAGHKAEAKRDLRRYLQLEPDAEDAPGIIRWLNELDGGS
ncbi:MAG: transglutaminase-like domain-containing protein, partial [Geitlerinemataceae cyanobacterium]